MAPGSSKNGSKGRPRGLVENSGGWGSTLQANHEVGVSSAHVHEECHWQPSKRLEESRVFCATEVALPQRVGYMNDRGPGPTGSSRLSRLQGPPGAPGSSNNGT
eukprot:4743787-Pyramimonas_sp.AAC.1